MWTRSSVDDPAHGPRDMRRRPRHRAPMPRRPRGGSPRPTFPSVPGRPTGFGRRHRKEDLRVPDGAGKYVDDVNLPGKLHGAIPHGPIHGRRQVAGVARGPLREPDVHLLRPRSPHDRFDRGDRGDQGPGTPGRRVGRSPGLQRGHPADVAPGRTGSTGGLSGSVRSPDSDPSPRPVRRPRPDAPQPRR